jgi:hypothetical protein
MSIKFYKDENNNIYNYDSDGYGSEDDFIRDGLTEISASALATLRDSQIGDTYQEKRVSEYPSMGDQLDALYHAGSFPAAMTASIKAIKDKYPKG